MRAGTGEQPGKLGYSEEAAGAVGVSIRKDSMRSSRSQHASSATKPRNGRVGPNPKAERSEIVPSARVFSSLQIFELATGAASKTLCVEV